MFADSGGRIPTDSHPIKSNDKLAEVCMTLGSRDYMKEANGRKTKRAFKIKKKKQLWQLMHSGTFAGRSGTDSGVSRSCHSCGTLN